LDKALGYEILHGDLFEARLLSCACSICSHRRTRCVHHSRGSHVHAPIHPRRRLWREIFAGVPGDGTSSRAVVLTRHRDPRTAVVCDSLGRVFNPRNASRQHTRARLTIHPRCISTHAGGAASSCKPTMTPNARHGRGGAEVQTRARIVQSACPLELVATLTTSHSLKKWLHSLHRASPPLLPPTPTIFTRA